MRRFLAAALLAGWGGVLMNGLSAAAGADNGVGTVAAGDFWKADAAVYGDGRPAPKADAAHLPHGFRVDYAVHIPESGWYGLYLFKAGDHFSHDVLVDGKIAYLDGSTDKPAADGYSKAANLWLEAGKHTLRIKRVGRNSFPMRIFERFELRRADQTAGAVVRAEKPGQDVMRAGEHFALKLTAGGVKTPVKYEIFRHDLLAEKNGSIPGEPVAALEFPAGEMPQAQTVEIACPQEGIFRLSAKADGQELPQSSFGKCIYAVVDMKPGATSAATSAMKGSAGKTEMLHEIDCVRQTDLGKAMDAAAFVECNGPTRVSTSGAGEYRESHDCTPPQAEIPAHPSALPRSYSGFSYRFSVPQEQVPYLLEVEFPDDARRSVTINLNWLNPGTNILNDANNGYQGKAYETGGFFPLTGQMRWHRMVFWPLTKDGLIGVLSQQPGQRAAIKRIRISRFTDGTLPVEGGAAVKNGRVFAHWYEEIDNWKYLVGTQSIHPQQAARTFVGLQRWAQLARYFGANALSGMGAGYQEAFWRSQVMEGLEYVDFDIARLACLLCEKYGMKFIPEIFINQWYMDLVTFPELAANPQDVRSVNCHGGESGRGSAPCNLNPLHPVVQQRYIDGLGELADKLRDSPAFAGLSVRADGWLFRGEFFYPSLYWGYGDWTIREFEKDSGVAVPGGPSDAQSAQELGANDPRRYARRYEFLTSPAMKDKWIAWRCGRIEDYHQRILQRLRGERKDIYFGIAGSFECDNELYLASDKIAERALGSGIDLRRRAQSDGLSVIAVGRYGCRETGITERAIYDGFFDRENVRAGMCSPRAFASYMTYHELNTNWPADKLGIQLAKKDSKPPYYCSAAVAAGRNSLEKYAVVLAEQDTAYLREGGNADSFGDPELWRPWMREYAALPALPFDPAPGKNDPVAVWSKEISAERAAQLDLAPGLYFYVVNRERYAVKVTLRLQNAASVRRLTGAEEQPLAGGALTLTLEPFDLVAFRAPEGAAVRGVEAAAVAAQREYVRDRLAFAQEVGSKLRGSSAGNLLGATEAAAFREGLERAWDAAEEGQTWRARVELDMAALMKAYQKTGILPQGQIVTTFPDLLRSSGHVGHWNLTEPAIPATELMAAVTNKESCALRETAEINPEWRGEKTLWAGAGKIVFTLEVPAEGEYRLTLGQVAESAGVAVAYLNGKSLPEPVVFRQAKTPQTAAFAPVALQPGKIEVALQGTGGIGVYAVKLLPVLRPVPGTDWKVAGPFPSPWGGFNGHDAKLVKEALEASYPAETTLADQATFTTSDGKRFGWAFALPGINDAIADKGIMMPLRTYAPAGGINIAVTRIHSDRDRTALLYLAVDWWARAYLNGERLDTNISDKEKSESGADYTSHYPVYWSLLKLKKGENVLVVKQQGGSLGSALAGYVTADPGITTRAREK